MGFKTKILMAALASAMLGAGCSKSGGGSSSDPGAAAMTISGSLSIDGSTASNTLAVSPFGFKMLGSNKFAVTDYRIACATFEATPKSCGGDVGADGAFSVSCSGFTSVPFGCFVYHKTTYANYPITFNINSGSDQSTVAVSGNVSATIALDLETGTATAAATVATGTETTVTVDATKVANLNGVFTMAGAPYAEVSSKYTAEQLEFFKFIPCMMNNNGSAPDLTNCLSGSSETGYNMMAQEMAGGAVELYASTEAEVSYLSAWDGTGTRAACGNVETGFTWKVSDGDSGNGKADVTFDLSGADQTTLKTAVGNSVGSIITTYFPFLADGAGSASTFAASCKYAGNLDMNFWNNTPEQVAACQADTTNCFNGFGDAFGALQRYKFKKLWAEYNGTDTILGAVDYSGKLIAEGSATLKYGYRSWNSTTNQPEIVEIAGLNAGNVDNYRIDVGGCIQWPDWTDTSSTASRVATVVPVGDYITFHTPNGDMKDKCRMSEKRLLYQDDANGYIVVGGVKYKDINIFLDMGSGNFQETWNKVCQVGIDGDANGSIDNTGAPTTDIMMYPVDFDATKIASEAQNRFNGGNPEQRKGIKLDAIYTMLTEDPSHMNENFWYWDMATNSGGQLTCAEIKSPTANSSVVWAKVEKAMQNTFDPWNLRGLLACAMIGVANGEYDGDPNVPVGDTNDDMDGSNAAKTPKTLPAEYKDVAGNKLPDIVDSLKANSCIPKFQMSSFCSDDGFCEARVVCNSVTAANGGCDQAEPAARYAKMKAEGLGGDKFRFFNRDERFENFFDPSSNKSKQCTRGESMTITTEDAITTAPAAGQSVRLAFGRVESKVCDGETAEVMAFPAMYMDFTKQ